MKGKAAIGALLMLSILAGCGSGENSAVSQTPGPVTPSDPTASQTQPVTPGPAPPSDPTVSQSQPVTPDPAPEGSPVPPELGNAAWSDGTISEGESVAYYSFDYGSYLEYPSEADFLAVFGFEGVSPFFEYSYEWTAISVEGEEMPCTGRTSLYYSEELGTGCVVEDYNYGGTSRKWGSALDRVEQAEEDEWGLWTRWKLDPYSVPGLEELKEKIAAEDDWEDHIEDYQEHREYDEAGRLVSFRADGIFPSPWSNKDGRNPVASLSLTYGEDGKLREREIFRNDCLFGSTRMNQHSYYDDLGRVCCETCYITHGEEKFFYFYSDDGPAPAYCLYIDHWGSGVILAKY